jgi:hypothetical protein
MHIKIGDKVRWSTGHKPLGVVVHIFTNRQQRYAVVEDDVWRLRVVRIYEKLVVCQ